VKTTTFEQSTVKHSEDGKEYLPSEGETEQPEALGDFKDAGPLKPAADILDEFKESSGASDTISTAMAERKESLSSAYAICVEHIEGAERGWLLSRRTQNLAIFEGGLALPYSDTDDFKKLCDQKSARGDFPETRLVSMFAKDISPERRAEVAATMCWMHTQALCGGPHGPEDAERVVDFLILQGGRDKCAAAYREWITEHGKPGDFGFQTEANKKATVTRRAKGLRRRASAAAAAAEAGVVLSPEAQAKIDKAEGTTQPSPADEEFLEDLNLRDAVDRKVASLKPIVLIRVGKKVVPDVGVYIIRKVDEQLRVFGPVIDETVIRATLRHLPEGQTPSATSD